MGTIGQICSGFGLGELVEVRELGGTRNVSFAVTTNHGKWLVRRRYEGYCEPERIAFDHTAARFLSEHGAAVPPPISETDGSTFWKNDQEIWEVYPWIEGRFLKDGEAEDVRILAEALAKLHEAGNAFQLRYDKRGPRGETDPQTLLANADRVEAESPDTAQVLADYRRAIIEAEEKLPLSLYSSLPHTLVHGDVQPANILVGNGRINGFIDLDWVAWRPRIYDLAFALLCCVASHEKPVGEGDIWSISQSQIFDAATVEEFLAVYQHHTLPLTNRENAALGPQMELTWCHIRVDNSLKAPPEERRVFLERDSEADSVLQTLKWHSS